MTELATALALVLVLEGLLWALFPDGMKRVAAKALVVRSGHLRLAGLLAMAAGVVLIWLIRG